MATIETQKSICPNCKHTLFRGPLTIGPSAVNCKKCDQLVNTGLDSWLELSLLEKINVVMSEIFAPSFLGDRDNIGRLFLNGIICLFFAIPFIMTCIRGDSQASVSEKIIAILISFLYEGFLVIRILRLRSQSMIYYNKKDIIPKW